MKKKRSLVHFKGLAKVKKTKRTVHVQVRITDPTYEFSILKDDIRTKRVWLETSPDDDGWMKLLYSADGPTGDPIPVGKVRISLDSKQLSINFEDLFHLTIEEVKEE